MQSTRFAQLMFIHELLGGEFLWGITHDARPNGVIPQGFYFLQFQRNKQRFGTQNLEKSSFDGYILERIGKGTIGTFTPWTDDLRHVNHECNTINRLGFVQGIKQTRVAHDVCTGRKPEYLNGCVLIANVAR